jgi:bifunctional ADP-heptose synthase (sugar kinase/adenylyltransferase)
MGTLTVFVNNDLCIRDLKGAQRPIIPLPHRLRMLKALRCVAHVHVFQERTPVAAWTRLNTVPDFYVKDEECDITHSEEGEWMLRNNVAITLLRRLPGVSTTSIISRIRADHGGA